MQRAPGRTFLNMVGIVFILLGGMALFNAVLSTSVVNMLKEGTADPELVQVFEETGETLKSMQVAVVISFIQGALYVVSGILGLINGNKAERANICLICGGLLLLNVLFNAGYSMMTGNFNLPGSITSLLLPILYTWGGWKNRQAMLGKNMI